MGLSSRRSRFANISLFRCKSIDGLKIAELSASPNWLTYLDWNRCWTAPYKA
jgi:hypothetical protein